MSPRCTRRRDAKRRSTLRSRSAPVGKGCTSTGSPTRTTEERRRNVTEFPPNRWHELHRHPHAEEYFYVVRGSGLHLTEDEPVRLAEGDLVFVARNEWHGFANDTDEPVLAVTVMGGVAHYRGAGYEARDEDRPAS